VQADIACRALALRERADFSKFTKVTGLLFRIAFFLAYYPGIAARSAVGRSAR
jgi:hypothetical protein